jgi:PAS domain S-box-containing protein
MAVTSHEAAVEATDAIHRALLGDALAAASTLAAFVLEEDGRCVAVNDAACRLCGRSRQQLVGTPIGSFEPQLSELHRGARGRAWLERREGGHANVEYSASATRIGAIPYVVVVCWPTD